MSFSNAAEEIALRAVLDNSFVGLTTTTPTDTSPGTEVSAPEYSRRGWTPAYTQGTPSWATNSTAIEYPSATSSWGELSYAVFFTAAVGGTYLGYAELRDPNDPNTPLTKIVTSGDILRFAADALMYALD